MQRHLVQLFLKYVCPAFLLLFLVTPVVGHFFTWPQANAYLAAQSGQIPLLIGFGVSFPSESQRHLGRESRQYIFIPAAFTSPTSVTITQVGTKEPVVVVNKYGFAVWLARLFALAGITWWFWARRKRPAT